MTEKTRLALGLFEEFASRIQITSRDEGIVKFKIWQCQRLVLEQLFEAYYSGKRHILILKCRQLGISTVMLAFDVFWSALWPGLQGLIAPDSDDNREYFRGLLKEIVERLPRKFRLRMTTSNRSMAEFSNGSRLLFQTAGRKANTNGKGSALGRARGLNFFHGTEVASWGDAAGIASLRAALSERHPAAIYIWESTANGFNHFYDMWIDAQHAVTTQPIFVTWWHHELYTVDKKSQIYKVYWDGELRGEERSWAEEVERRYGYTITPQQWAWYRWKLAEEMTDDEHRMHEEYPTLPEHAFQSGGYSFMGSDICTGIRRQLSTPPPVEWCDYQFGPTIESSACVPATEYTGTLAVWEQPQAQAQYVVACDPAYGASPTSDRAVVQVWRGTRSRLIQVAEFSSSLVGMQQLAWIVVHLAGEYREAHTIIELQGPGMGVWQELTRINQGGWSSNLSAEKLQAIIGPMRHYLWTRPDSLGSGLAWQWKTTPQAKLMILFRLRDQIMRGAVVVRSKMLLEEMESLRQDGEQIEAHGRAHDDRAITAAMAVQCWMENVQPNVRMPAVDDRDDLTPVAQTPQALHQFFSKLKVASTGAPTYAHR